MASINTKMIRTTFETMEYGKIEEDVQIAKDWLKKRNNTIHSSGVDTPSGLNKDLINKISGEKVVTIYLADDNVKQKIEFSLGKNTSWTNSSSLERTKLMKKFATEIERNSDLICRLESCTRGLLSKDTKKYGVLMLVEYIHYFANWTFVPINLCNKTSIVHASTNTCLGVLGFALGPSLAHGCNVIFQVEPELSPCVTLLIELSIIAGIPDGVLQIITSDDNLWTPSAPAMLYLFGDLGNKKFNRPELYSNKQVVAVSNNKIPLIVFENSDLDSACECAVDAIWDYGGMMPWAVDTILVQENVYEEFLSKVKLRMKSLRVGKGNDKLADISYPTPSEIEKLKKIIIDARVQGIDVYQLDAESSEFQPILFMGTKVYNNNVINEDLHAPAATVLAFRTPKEAVALANNTRQGFAASVWCEEVSLLNEVVKQLNVGTVWVNSHGIIKASIPFTTYKLDGAGYIGGSQGFYEHEDQNLVTTREQLMNSPPKSVADAIASARKAQASWSKLSLDERVKVLSQWVLNLENHKSEICGIHNWDEFISTVYECITKFSTANNSITIGDFEVTVKRESVGVVVSYRQETINIPLILGALLLGNSVILVAVRYPEMYNTIAKFLPPGLLTPIEFHYIEFLTRAQANPRTVIEGIQSISERFQKCYCELENWESILRRCTFSKNIWMTSGDSVL